MLTLLPLIACFSERGAHCFPMAAHFPFKDMILQVSPEPIVQSSHSPNEEVPELSRQLSKVTPWYPVMEAGLEPRLDAQSPGPFCLFAIESQIREGSLLAERSRKASQKR